MGSDLRSYLSQLPDLITVEEPVDPVTQVGAIVSASPAPIRFTRLRGFPEFSLVDLLVKDRRHQALALGIADPARVVPELAARLRERAPAPVRPVAEAPCQEVVWRGDAVDVTRLPIPVHSEGDAGRYIGSGVTITQDPDSGMRNQAIIRAQVKGPRHLGFWMAARHNWAHYQKWEARGQPMPMAYAIGLHPAYEIAANYSGPHPHYEELQLGAAWLGEPLDLVPAVSIDLLVPAAAEIVIEGVVPPQVREPEGPFGEFTTYRKGAEGPAPVWEVTAVTMRRGAIFRHMQATWFTDHQPLVALPMEAGLFQRLSEVQGGSLIHDVHVAPWASLFLVLVQMTPRWEGQARAVGLAALSSSYLHPKVVVVVDEDVDIYNPREVLWAISTRVHPELDVHILPRERIHPLDISAPSVAPEEVTVLRVGSKMLIDATKPPTWRPEARRAMDRVQPQGAGDAVVQAIIERIRQHRR